MDFKSVVVVVGCEEGCIDWTHRAFHSVHSNQLMLFHPRPSYQTAWRGIDGIWCCWNPAGKDWQRQSSLKENQCVWTLKICSGWDWLCFGRIYCPQGYQVRWLESLIVLKGMVGHFQDSLGGRISGLKGRISSLRFFLISSLRGTQHFAVWGGTVFPPNKLVSLSNSL